MPYTIEVISLGQDLYPAIEKAIQAINAVQREFSFTIPGNRLKTEGFPFQRKEYHTQEVFDFLRNYRAQAKGHRPYLLAVLNAPLKSEKLQNLFGSHEAEEGLAVISLFDCTRFADSEHKFLCYYFIRYSLSFIAPQLKVHRDTRSCFFDAKLNKFDLQKSLRTGELCDECMSILQKNFNPEIYEAILRMTNVLLAGPAANVPLALVMKGGGIKGLAYIGALAELTKYYTFNRFIGTSAGAITAVLLAGGYTTEELKSILKEKDFKEFFDANIIVAFFNLVFHQGLYRAGTVTKWLDDLLAAKLKSPARVTLGALPFRATIYASRRNKDALIFDGRDPETSGKFAAYAARSSMAIPFVFTPAKDEDMNVFDGGLRHNYPIQELLANDTQGFIGLYLGPKVYEGKAKPDSVLSDLSNIFLEATDVEALQRYADRTVMIDTRPISVLDFGLTDQEKGFLLKEGRAAALEFLGDKVKEITADIVSVARAEAEEARQEVIKSRKARTRKRLSILLCVLLTALVLLGLRRFIRRVPTTDDYILPKVSQLDSTFVSLQERNNREAAEKSSPAVKYVPYMLKVSWRSPKYFAEREFAVQLESSEYDIEGFAGIHVNAQGQQSAIEPCRQSLRKLVFKLPTDAKTAYFFVRIRTSKDFSYPDPRQLIQMQPGTVNQFCSIQGN